jgi:putative DNA primase/helicase
LNLNLLLWNGEFGIKGKRSECAMTSSKNALDVFQLAKEFIAENSMKSEPCLRHWNGEWYRWNGQGYGTASVDTLKKLLLAYLHKGRTSTSRSTINAVLEMAKLQVLVEDATAPSWLSGSSPYPADELVAVGNGLLHLPTLLTGQSTLLSHTPALFTLNALRYNYEEDATCPTWERLLTQIWPKDVDSIRTLQEWFGYVLLPDTRQQKLLMLIGPPRSGKGTIARILRMMLGESNVASPMMRSLSGSFGLWGLPGKLLAIVPDASEARASNSLVELVKCLTGEDAIDVDRKNLAPMSSVKLTTRLMVIANQAPLMTDSSGAIGHRIVALETRRSWAGQEDQHLTDRLMAELPGILLWAMKGWRRLNDRGHFRQPQSSQHIVEQYQCPPSVDPPNGIYRVQRATAPNGGADFGDESIYITIRCGGRGLQRCEKRNRRTREAFSVTP